MTHFWHSKRVLITGGRGFLGRQVNACLSQKPVASVYNVRSADYNLLEQSAVRQLFADQPVDLVIHLAASVGGIGFNRENPGKLFYENMLMGAMLLEEARLHAVAKVVVIGTICAYPKFTKVPFCEQDLWQGYPEETNAPYGIAKKALLTQCQAYRNQYDCNYIYLLPVNLYGPCDNFDLHSSHVIPALIRKFVEAKENNLTEVPCWGDGSPTREFLYVTDCAKAIVKASEHYNAAEPVNVGAGSEISIADLAEQIADLVGYQGKITWDTHMPGGQPRRCLDTSKAKKHFGFVATTSLKDGLRQTIDWYLKNRS